MIVAIAVLMIILLAAAGIQILGLFLKK